MRLPWMLSTVALLAACASEPASKLPSPSATVERPAAEPAAEPSAAREAAPSPAAAAAAVTRVEPSLVCMVNNQFMGKAQIPVVVEGKTYYGCCEMCKSKLADDASSRTATDPVSGAEVDKAVAVIGRDPTGSVHYFENEQNLHRYATR